MIQQPQLTTLNIASITDKLSSKRDIFNFLTVEMGAYMPPYKDVSTFFLKDVLTGKRKVILVIK